MAHGGTAWAPVQKLWITWLSQNFTLSMPIFWTPWPVGSTLAGLAECGHVSGGSSGWLLGWISTCLFMVEMTPSLVAGLNSSRGQVTGFQAAGRAPFQLSPPAIDLEWRHRHMAFELLLSRDFILIW